MDKCNDIWVARTQFCIQAGTRQGSGHFNNNALPFVVTVLAQVRNVDGPVSCEENAARVAVQLVLGDSNKGRALSLSQ